MTLPTARSIQANTGHGIQVFCRSCGHQVDRLDLDAVIRAGKGDVPLVDLRLRCSACGSRDVLTTLRYFDPRWD